MRLLTFAMAFALLSCASGELDPSSSAVDTEKDGGKSTSGKKIDTSDDATEPDPKAKPSDDSNTPPTDATDDETDDGGSAPPPVTPSTATCTSQTGGHTSVSVLTYTDKSGSIEIVSMTTTVTNAQGRNLNDLSVYVPSSAGDYEDAYDSGDILANGKAVSIALPSNIAIYAGDKIRIDTNFDEAWVPDPVASCFVQF